MLGAKLAKHKTSILEYLGYKTLLSCLAHTSSLHSQRVDTFGFSLGSLHHSTAPIRSAQNADELSKITAFIRTLHLHEFGFFHSLSPALSREITHIFFLFLARERGNTFRKYAL